MATLLDKHRDNLKAAKLCYANSLYSSTVHSSYYSCFQLLKHILNGKCGINYQSQEQRCRQQDSHKVITNLFIEDVSQKVSSQVSTSLQTRILNLKKLRVKSDYKPVMISQTESDYAITESENVSEEIKQIYSI